MSLLNQLRNLFNPPVEVSDAPVGDHRGAIKKPTQVPTPVSPSTFSPVVPWATQKIEPALIVTPPPPPPEPVSGYLSAGLSGCFIQHTAHLQHCLGYTGMISMDDQYPRYTTISG